MKSSRRYKAPAILKPVIAVFALVYFLADLVFATALQPFFRWFASLRLYGKIKNWVQCLGPCMSLALFLVPLIVLEPLKPAGVYLIAVGRF